MNLSIQSVADRAGVSHRTVYNHFENKDRLVQDLGRHVNDQIVASGGRNLPDDLDALPDAIRRNWALFDEAGVKTEALARVMLERVSQGGGYTSSEPSRERTAALREAISEARPDLDRVQVDAITALFRTQVSFHMWYRLSHEFDVATEQAGEVAAWAFRVLRDALVNGDGPFD